MRTLLSQFCEEFDSIVRNLLDPLQRTSRSLEQGPRDLLGDGFRAAVLDLHHQFEVLADKVAEQQAYVLIFGPLKSGKSTLMNAISASYVSEVSSLPAYPCMVYVSHSEKREFTLTAYDGNTQVFTDPTALHITIKRGHDDLAKRIRDVEDRGEQFDPALHYPEAIRRIDVKLPAGHLAQSGAVLVDTPGLYSRMKFGYDRMTREFRNAAACAIFIVKSDNLFLEQVFEEFNELLELFSQIFLVVNLDTNKCDLGPDGNLVPSLESEDPLRIIEAFERLAMSAPLKHAADQGRLRIYPVDLLSAASRRLRAAQGGVEEPEAPSRGGQASFDSFIQDFTDYLNSADYLVAFLGDSLRRATSLLGETSELCEQDAVDALRERVGGLETEAADVRRRHEAAERLAAFDWNQPFAELEQEQGGLIQAKSRLIATQASEKVRAQVDAWFETDASLQSLIEDDLVPTLMGCQDEIASYVGHSLEDCVAEGTAGIRVPLDVGKDLGTAEIDLSDLGRVSLDGINRAALSVQLDAPLRAEEVPVRKSLLDWLLFRGTGAVRRRMLGDPARPTRPIPVDVKRRRLGPARGEMLRALQQHKDEFFAEIAQRMKRGLLGDYARSTVERMGALLDERRSELERRRTSLEQQLDGCRGVLAQVADLKGETTRAQNSIDVLGQRYGKTDPDLLRRPVEEAGDAGFGLREVWIEPARRGAGEADEPTPAPAETDESRIEAP